MCYLSYFVTSPNYTITQADIDAGSVTNAAHATGTFGNNTTTSNTDNETVTAVQGSSAFPALIIGKSASPEIYNTVGQNITYTYTVTNYGNVNITGPINVTDSILGIVNITAGDPVSYTHLRAHETDSYLVCRLL